MVSLSPSALACSRVSAHVAYAVVCALVFAVPPFRRKAHGLVETFAVRIPLLSLGKLRYGPVLGVTVPGEVLLRVDSRLIEPLLDLVHHVRILRLAHGRARVVFAERVDHGVGLVHEIKDEHLILAGVDAVDARIGLHDLDVVGDGLVDVQGAELGLVESGLELVRHDHESVLRGVERVLDGFVAEVVHIRLGIVVVRVDRRERVVLEVFVLRDHALGALDLVRERHQWFSGNLELQMRLNPAAVQFRMGPQVRVERILVPDHGRARRA